MAGPIAGMLIPLLMIVASLILVASVWKVFAKAGKPGWACLVPIYNVVVLLQIAGRPVWWLVLFFIPFVNIVVSFVVAIELARSFRKGIGFGFGLFFLGFVFYPVLGFGNAQYAGFASR